MSVPPRTNPPAVIAILGDDFGPRASGTVPDLLPFIQSASAVVDRVQTAALAKPSPVTLSAVELELIERWYAAHLYTTSDPIYTSKNTQGASGSFVRAREEPYLDRAISMDYSGMLNAIVKRQFIQVAWLGKPPSAQVPYEQRD